MAVSASVTGTPNRETQSQAALGSGHHPVRRHTVEVPPVGDSCSVRFLVSPGARNSPPPKSIRVRYSGSTLMQYHIPAIPIEPSKGTCSVTLYRELMVSLTNRLAVSRLLTLISGRGGISGTFARASKMLLARNSPRANVLSCLRVTEILLPLGETAPPGSPPSFPAKPQPSSVHSSITAAEGFISEGIVKVKVIGDGGCHPAPGRPSVGVKAILYTARTAMKAFPGCEGVALYLTVNVNCPSIKAGGTNTSNPMSVANWVPARASKTWSRVVSVV